MSRLTTSIGGFLMNVGGWLLAIGLIVLTLNFLSYLIFLLIASFHPEVFGHYIVIFVRLFIGAVFTAVLGGLLAMIGSTVG